MFPLSVETWVLAGRVVGPHLKLGGPCLCLYVFPSPMFPMGSPSQDLSTRVTVHTVFSDQYCVISEKPDMGFRLNILKRRGSTIKQDHLLLGLVSQIGWCKDLVRLKMFFKGLEKRKIKIITFFWLKK